MSTLQAPRVGPYGSLASRGSRAQHAAGRADARQRASRTLAGALLALVLLAAFDHGAVGVAAGARIEALACLFAAVAAGGVLWTGALRLRTSRLGWAALGLLGAFVAWSGISLAWSASPEGTWLELNRILAYGLVLVLAVILGASGPSATDHLRRGFAVLVGIVAAYALAQKLLPEVHLGSLLNLDQTGSIPRLQEPLGYWNALALFLALGVPLALFAALDRARGPRARASALAGAQLLLVTIGFTLSRGGLLALVLALAIALPLAGVALRGLMWSLVACLGAAPPLIVGLSLHALSAAGVPVSDRAGAGAILAGVLLLSLAGSAVATLRLIELESQIRLAPQQVRRLKRYLAAGALFAVLAGVGALAVSSRGLGGQVSHAWHSFTAKPTGSVYDPQHLLSQDSEHRWAWWKEAAGAFSARPLAGWGAGSFGVVHLLYRRDSLSVAQPHSLPLQFLSETGAIGALLGLGALTLLALAAARSVRRAGPGDERLCRAALLGGALAFLIHSLYDWSWDIPGVALPALVFLGVLVGSSPARARLAAHEPSPGDAATPPAPANAADSWRPAAHRPRAGRLAYALLALGAAASAAVLPSLAAGDASAALVAAGSGSLASAEREALLASSLDRLSDAGLRVQATIALREGSLPRARTLLRQALIREPTDVEAWQQLAEVDLLLGELTSASQAAERALALDPHGLAAGAAAFEISQIAGLLQAPPRDSATALITPAPPGSRHGRHHLAPATAPPATPLHPIVPGVNDAGLSRAGAYASPTPAPQPAPPPRRTTTQSAPPPRTTSTSSTTPTSTGSGQSTTTTSGGTPPVPTVTNPPPGH